MYICEIYAGRQQKLKDNVKMKLPLKTERLQITEFEIGMAESVCRLSHDEDNRRFVPDEVFETVGEAQKIINTIIGWYAEEYTPKIYAVTINGQHIGHIQAVPIGEANWEIGYHIGKEYTGKGYATEVVKAFLPNIMKRLKITKIFGICHAQNTASCKVLEKSGFILEFKGDGKLHNKTQEICRYIYIL